MIISSTLKRFLIANNFVYRIESEEDYGCWNRGCSHFHNELKIHKKGITKYGFSFEEGCSDEMITATLLSRLAEMKTWIISPAKKRKENKKTLPS